MAQWQGCAKRLIIPVILLLVAALLLASPSAACATGQAKAVDVDATKGREALLQFTSAGHVLGFSEDSVIVASAGHMLKTEFVNADAVVPEVDGSTTEAVDGMAATLGRVTYRNLWDGVTLVYEGGGEGIAKSTYYLDDGMASENIRLRYNRPVSLDEQGNLDIAYDNGTVVEGAPVSWQEIECERIAVAATYVLHGEREVGFSLGDCVPGIPVVVDPPMTWNTFLGGTGGEYGRGIAVDGSGNVYVVGESDATWGSPIQAYTADVDAFAAKLDSSGNLIWNTFLGGTGGECGRGIAVDGSGNVYVSGYSNAAWGSPVRAYAGGSDAFAAKVDGSGSLIWNTFLGGSSSDEARGIAVDGSGNAYVAGYSDLAWGSPVRTFTAGHDAFVAKVDSSGSLSWNTFLGGSGDDSGNAIAADGSGNVYVAGHSELAWGSPVRAFTTGNEAFMAKVDSSGSLSWNTFLGGSTSDEAEGIAVDGSGNVYVGGSSYATWGSPVRTCSGNFDAFVAKVDSSGNLTWNTFLGSSDPDWAGAIAADGSGNVYIVGSSDATWGSPVRAYTSIGDAFAAKLDSSGSLTWSTFLGGGGVDEGYAVGVDGSKNVYIGGSSYATWGSPVRTYTAGIDAFAVQLDSNGLLYEVPTVTTQAVSSISTTTATGNGNITNLGAPNPTAHGVCWNATGMPTTSDSKTNEGAASATGAFATSMTGLIPGTTYYVRAYATNSVGTSYGAQVSFTAYKVPTVTTQAVSGIFTTTAIGNGNITDLGVPNPTARGVCWNATGMPTTSDSKTNEGAASATGAFFSYVPGLTPGTTYYLRAYATNTAGTSYGSEVTFTTASQTTHTGDGQVLAQVNTTTQPTATDTAGNALQVTGQYITVSQAGSTLTISIPVALSEGAALASFTDAAGLTFANNTLVIPTVSTAPGGTALLRITDQTGDLGTRLIIQMGDATGTGDSAEAEVVSIRAEAGFSVLPLRSEVASKVEFDLNTLPEDAVVNITIRLEPDSAAGSALASAAKEADLKDMAIAYVVNVERTNLTNGTDIKSATITMKAGADWVEEHGGVEAIRILRYDPDSDAAQVLDTTFIGSDEAGRPVFEAVSPDGLSVFALVGTASNTGGGVPLSLILGVVAALVVIVAAGIVMFLIRRRRRRADATLM